MGLELCEWQFSVKHTSTADFEIGEAVFLKSNPEMPMVVVEVTSKHVVVVYESLGYGIDSIAFFPECLLQYKWAGLKVHIKGFLVSLN